jgi:hypothetical protein
MNMGKMAWSREHRAESIYSTVPAFFHSDQSRPFAFLTFNLSPYIILAAQTITPTLF